MRYDSSYNEGYILPGHSKPPQPDVITDPIAGAIGGQQPQIHVRDITNGYDLYTVEADTVNPYPASVTKLMTLLLTWEYMQASWADTLTITAADVTQPYTADSLTLSFAGLEDGDVLTWEDLVYCMILPSGGDACQAAARLIGTLIHDQAGSGDTGNARFVERMNERATELGMTNTVYFDSLGGSKASGITRNTITPRDLSTIAAAALTIPAIRTIAQAATRDVTITGSNARTLSLSNVIGFINGPTLNPAGFRDQNVLAAKTGDWSVTGVEAHNMACIWKSPAGYEIVVSTIGSIDDFSMMMDQRGLHYQLMRDFPYLRTSPNSDSHYSQVKVLIGADGSIVDEAVGRTLINSGVTVGDPVIQGTGSLLFDNVSDSLTTADASDLAIGSSDLTLEQWYAGPGASPGNGVEYLFFIKAGSNEREYACNFFNGALNIFASSDGSNWTTTVAINLNSTDQAVFFNGAPRHLAFVKNGSTWSFYLNGEQMAGTISVGTVFDGNAAMSISATLLGNVDDFRMTLGTARYTDAMVTLVAQKFPRS